MKATHNKNTLKPVKEIRQGKTIYRFYADSRGELYCPQVRCEELLLARAKNKEFPPGPSELRLIKRIAENPQEWRRLREEFERYEEEHEDVFNYAIRLSQKKKADAEQSMAMALFRYGFSILSRLGPCHSMGEYLEKISEPVEVEVEPVPVKKARPQGSHKRLRAMLRPKWVNVSQAARALSIERSTILSWYAAGQVVLPGQGGGTHVVRLYRGPLGEVNLTLLQHICEQKRALPAPGRRLGGGSSRGLVAAATRAHSDPEKAANYSRTCKALSLLERVQDEQLLQAARRSINRLILRRRRA